MRTIAFVAPFATANTLRYCKLLVELEGVQAAIISADPKEKFGLLGREVGAFAQVKDPMNGRELAQAGELIRARCGRLDRLFGALEQLQLPIGEARDLLKIEGMGAEVVRRFRDKSAMKAALRDGGVPCARFARVEKGDDARRFADQVGYPLIIKPTDGLGTRSTWRLEDRGDLEEALKILRPSPGRAAQCEEFLVGTEHSFETVSIDGKAIWSSSTDYIPGPLEVLNTPWIQYCVLLPREEENLESFRAVNHRALEVLGMKTGLSHMELFRRNDGTVAVNEVGARPPGVNIMPLMSAAHKVDFYERWIRLMALDEFEPPRRHRAAGTAFLRGQGRGTKVIALENLPEVLEEIKPYLYESSLPRVGQSKGPGYEGEGYVIVTAEKTEEVLRCLARAIRKIRIILG